MAKKNYPDLVALKEIKGKLVLSGVVAGSTVTETIVLDENVLIIGIPEVSVDVGVVEVINGGKNKFTVKVTNDSGVDADITVSYIVYVVY